MEAVSSKEWKIYIYKEYITWKRNIEYISFYEETLFQY